MPYKDPTSPEAREAARRAVAKYRAKKPPAVRRAALKAQRKKSGIIDATGEDRFGVCPICLRERPLVCDHWHDGPKKGHIRGWICGTCNSGLGFLEDSADNLGRGRTYLLADQSEVR